MRIIFTGSGEFGIPTLAALVDAGHKIFPYTQPDRPAGRGRKLTPTPIAQFAQERGLKAIQTANLNAERLPAADLMIVIAFGQKIAPPVVKPSATRQRESACFASSQISRGRSDQLGDPERRNRDGQQRHPIWPKKWMPARFWHNQRFPIGEIETAGELHDRLAHRRRRTNHPNDRRSGGRPRQEISQDEFTGDDGAEAHQAIGDDRLESAGR